MPCKYTSSIDTYSISAAKREHRNIETLNAVLQSTQHCDRNFCNYSARHDAPLKALQREKNSVVSKAKAKMYKNVVSVNQHEPQVGVGFGPRAAGAVDSPNLRYPPPSLGAALAAQSRDERYTKKTYCKSYAIIIVVVNVY